MVAYSFLRPSVEAAGDEESLTGSRALNKAPGHLVHNDGALSRNDYRVLSLIAAMMLLVIGRMEMRDLHNEYAICGDEPISKHLHCVGPNSTRSFANFLLTQGARKGHPLYQAAEPTNAEYYRERAAHSGRRKKAKTGNQDHAVAAERDDADGGDEDDQWLDPSVFALSPPSASR